LGEGAYMGSAQENRTSKETRKFAREHSSYMMPGRNKGKKNVIKCKKYALWA